jgi:hypothetical protein
MMLMLLLLLLMMMNVYMQEDTLPLFLLVVIENESFSHTHHRRHPKEKGRRTFGSSKVSFFRWRATRRCFLPLLQILKFESVETLSSGRDPENDFSTLDNTAHRIGIGT